MRAGVDAHVCTTVCCCLWRRAVMTECWREADATWLSAASGSDSTTGRRRSSSSPPLGTRSRPSGSVRTARTTRSPRSGSALRPGRRRSGRGSWRNRMTCRRCLRRSWTRRTTSFPLQVDHSSSVERTRRPVVVPSLTRLAGRTHG